MEKPLVSVLMTSYNAEPFIAKAIQSVFDQSYSNWELLILDDVSTDGTRKVIDSFSSNRIRKIYPDKNIGYVASKNYLLKEFHGEFACFLDADDWMHRSRINVQAGYLIGNPDVGACMCSYIRVQPGGAEVPMHFSDRNQFLNILKHDIRFPAAGIMFSKKVFQVLGGFNMYFDKLLGDDAYWAFRIAEKFKFYYLNEPLYYYRANSESITANINDIRKFTVLELVQELKRQRLQRGSDWLEEGQYEEALKYELTFGKNYRWLAEKYRAAAAVRLDYKDRRKAYEFLSRSLKLNPFCLTTYSTVAYLLKRLIRK